MLWWSLTASKRIPNSWTDPNSHHCGSHYTKITKKAIPHETFNNKEMKDRAGKQTIWQIRDELDQTANPEQVGHCGLERGQFILVSRWPFKLGIECCWWAEVYQCPCSAGYELIPCWYSWCCESSCASTPPLHTTSPFLKGSKSNSI